MTRLPKPIATGVYEIGLGGVNALLIDLDDGGLVLVDAGFARSGPRIGQAIRDLGRAPSDLRAVVMTHLHGDHTGDHSDASAGPDWRDGEGGRNGLLGVDSANIVGLRYQDGRGLPRRRFVD